MSPPRQARSLPQKLVPWVTHALSSHFKMRAAQCALPSYVVKSGECAYCKVVAPSAKLACACI